MTFSIPPRLTLLIIASLFVLPLLLAWLMYSGSLNFEPGAGKNLGTLVEPPLAIDWKRFVTARSTDGSSHSDHEVADNLLEHWVILYPVPAACNETCKHWLSALRQIHRAAGRHQPRIRLALVLEESHSEEITELLVAIYGKFSLLTNPSGSMLNVLQEIREPLKTSLNTGAGTYLIDPLGNIMMAYTADTDPNDIRLDLKRLLTWSKLDKK
jgi:cytochrome oxidase Cu insertion factor (SCO1/SenC/PrrC family)